MGLLALFVLMTLFDFPLWQQAGLASALALVYGSIWFSQSEPGTAAEAAPAYVRAVSAVWYWSLAVCEWLGYLGVLCFSVALLFQVVP